MLVDYIYLKNENDKRVFISNLLHNIKYGEPEIISDLYNNLDLSFLDSLPDKNNKNNNKNSPEFGELCILATYVEHAFCVRGLTPPDWTKDKRLVLEQPCFIGAKTPDLVFHAPQACLNHNVFMLRNNFEVC